MIVLDLVHWALIPVAAGMLLWGMWLSFGAGLRSELDRDWRRQQDALAEEWTLDEGVKGPRCVPGGRK